MRISDWSSNVGSSDLQVVAGALLADHVLVDLAGGDRVLARQPGVDEALVVAEVQVGLGAVVGDVHLAVLERAHRARVDVDVRIELHHRHAQAARLEDGRQGSRGNALRSEEPTSELQSLMRISYAVFCLKKNKQIINKVNRDEGRQQWTKKTQRYH